MKHPKDQYIEDSDLYESILIGRALDPYESFIEKFLSPEKFKSNDLED